MEEERDPQSIVDEFQRRIRNIRFFTFETPEAQEAFRVSRFIGDERWKEMERYGRRLYERRERQDTEERIKREQQSAICEVADQFVETHFKGARKEKSLITEQIAKEVIAPEANYDFTVEEMLQTGLAGVRSKYRKRHLKHLRHSWTVIKGLVGLLVVLGIYSKMNTPFEVVVVSLLVLLYTHATRYLSSGLLAIANVNYTEYSRYLRLKEEIGKKETSSEEHEGLWDLRKTVEKNAIEHYVRDTCDTLVTLVVFWNILRVLLVAP